jgi:predicted small secreted protein
MRAARSCDRPVSHAFPEIPMKHRRSIALLVLAFFCMGALGACNTMEGLGKDVQKVGRKVEDKARH